MGMNGIVLDRTNIGFISVNNGNSIVLISIIILKINKVFLNIFNISFSSSFDI